MIGASGLLNSQCCTWVFAVSLPEIELEQVEACALARASESARAKVANMLRVEDRLRSLLGALLLRYALQCRGDGSERVGIVVTRDGKPRLHNYPSVHFNISHAGRWVVCAVSPHEVGVDVERCREINLDIARRFFQPNEHAALLAQEPHQRLPYFFRQWTAKEAYLKALGTGLQRDLDSFAVAIDVDGGVQLFEGRSPDQQWRIVQWQLDIEHPIALCESRRCNAHSFTLMHWDRLVQVPSVT